MTDDGWTKSYRRKWRHIVFRNFRDASIWAFLTDNAAWRDDTEVRFEDYRIVLARGQIAVSERFLSAGFCCDRQVVRRVLAALESAHMITRNKTTSATIITICNYEQYQSPEDTEKPTSAQTETHVEPTSNPNIEEPKKVKKEDFTPSLKAKRAGKPLRYFEEDEQLDPDFYSVCVEYPSLDPREEWEKFRDRNLSKGEGTASIKGSARTWCKNAILFAQRANLRLVK